MNEYPETTESKEALSRYRRPLLDYVRNLPLDEIFEEAEISRGTEEFGTKVPKMFIREILHGVKGIDQDLLNFGKEGGRICRRGPVDPE